MIASIKGKVLEIAHNSVVVDVGGVGYRVLAPSDVLTGAKLDGMLQLWTKLVLREDAIELYGFVTREDQTLFELLTSVSGIGPKTALTVMSIVTAAALRAAISSGETSYLTKVAGVGRKTAQKIIFELKDKIAKTDLVDASTLKADHDALEALRSLGYSVPECREVLKSMPPEIHGAQARIKEALKILGKPTR